MVSYQQGAIFNSEFYEVFYPRQDKLRGMRITVDPGTRGKNRATYQDLKNRYFGEMIMAHFLGFGLFLKALFFRSLSCGVQLLFFHLRGKIKQQYLNRRFSKMRKLSVVDEFKTEAGEAVFTKQQAVAVTLQLLQRELQSAENTEEDTRILSAAIQKAEFRYIDSTATETDRMLDSLSVARFKVHQITDALEALLFDVQ